MFTVAEVLTGGLPESVHCIVGSELTVEDDPALEPNRFVMKAVPEITPVLGFRVKPAGKLPEEILQVKGAVPPDSKVVRLVKRIGHSDRSRGQCAAGRGCKHRRRRHRDPDGGGLGCIGR